MILTTTNNPQRKTGKSVPGGAGVTLTSPSGATFTIPAARPQDVSLTPEGHMRIDH